MPRLIALILVALAGAPGFAQSPAPRGDGGARSDEPAGYGIMLTPAVFEKLLNRIGEKMGQDLGCDPLQTGEVQRIFKDRVKEFVKKNQTDISALANEFINATLDDGPPTAESVAAWAQKALPIIEQAQTMITGICDELRPVLNEDQMTKIDAGIAAAQVGFTMMNQKFNRWAEGGFTPEEWIQSPGAERRSREEARDLRHKMEDARRQRLAGGPSAATPDLPPTVAASDAKAGEGKGSKPADEPRDEWAIWVEEFCTKYEFNEDQKIHAKEFLTAAQTSRENYLNSGDTLKKIESLEKQFRSAAGDDEMAAAEKKYKALMKPVSDAFERLQEKVGKLPTRAQFRKVQEAEKQQKSPEEAAAKP